MSDNESTGAFVTRDQTGSPERLPGEPSLNPISPPGLVRSPAQESEAMDPPPAENLESVLRPGRTSTPVLQESKAERLRRTLLQQLEADYALEESPEDAKESAAENLEHYLKLKPLHVETMRSVRTQVINARYRLDDAILSVADLETALLEVEKDPSNLEATRNARKFLGAAKAHLEDWKTVESNLKALSDKAAEVFYRPKVEAEPGAPMINEVRSYHARVVSRLGAAEQELEAVLAPPPPPPASSPAPPALLLAEEKKPFARDYPIERIAKPAFSGDGPTALKDFSEWRGKWLHAAAKVKETCREADGDALLHLLRGVVTGTAAKLTSSALTVEAALATLEERYDDIVGLVNSYFPQHYTLLPPEPQDPEEHAAEASAFLDRWERMEEQLGTQGIDFKTFCAIRFLLDNFGPTAYAKWRQDVRSTMRRKPDGAKIGEAYNIDAFRQWILTMRDEAVAKKTQPEENTTSSAGLFACQVMVASAQRDAAGCLSCGPGAQHRSASCNKVAELPQKEYFSSCRAKGWCNKCAAAMWSVEHGRDCSQRCEKCQGRHLTSRHHLQPSSSSSSSATKRTGDNRDHSKEPSGKKKKAEASREPPRTAVTSEYRDDPGFRAAVREAVREERQSETNTSGRGDRSESRGRGHGKGRGRGRGKSFRGAKGAVKTNKKE